MTIQTLKSQNLILFEVISGSKSFGLNTPTSDTDIKGVYYLPIEKFFGLNYIPQIANETNDEVYYEIGRFVELLLKNNPNILEILASPEDCILYQHPLMDNLKIEDFLSKLCKDSFAGYAITQIKKARGLNKKIVNPMPKEKKSLLDFCYVLKGYETISLNSFLSENNFKQEQCGLVNLPNSKGMFALFYDENKTLGYKGIIQKENSNEVSLSSVPKNEKLIGYLSCNKDGYSKYCKEYTEYWSWIDKRNEDRYNTNQQHGKNYDSKNMMHTIRLLQTAEQILATGKLNIRVPNREELLDIKAGNKEYDALLEMADNLIVSIENHYQTSTLPEKPDEDKVIQTLIEIREELYK
ncbi:nucleotidyltransferase domain-containing protein [Flavobacterium sp. ALJ2]|uniref:DNA polymerase beta superfamily protein n=1 Tax=Flavobacterium sp. ALJ2 TaxID=2786960 RepID=UPI00189F9171|nr:nucleotidyltransferase domain-containing protein [Flavobacterium sp. ALJ2]MBF7090791.1 nucleotidyltransferase domain-containing protein [Flavobacterium sp. ALJ2]